jgi:imidazolonepropionase-like amidohydrolase
MYRIQGTFLPSQTVGEIFVRDGRFTTHPSEPTETLVTDAAILPGLVDVHAHLSLNAPSGTGGAEGVRSSLAAHLDSGVLAVREPGSYEYAGKEASAGDDRMPHVLTAGRFLAPPGAYFPGLAREVTDADLVVAGLEELAVSGSWVKIIGDTHMSGSLRVTYRPDTIFELAAAVHQQGGRVAVHCMLPETIQAALDAGFDSVEHGTMLGEDQISTVGSRTAWVPTVSINALVPPMLSEGFDADDVRRLVDGIARQGEVLRAADAAGVTILAGTDAGMTEHGTIAHEIALLLAAGLSAHTALGAGSWVARRWLGLPGIEEGAPADLVAYRADPREDLAELGRPALVMRAGRVLHRA